MPCGTVPHSQCWIMPVVNGPTPWLTNNREVQCLKPSFLPFYISFTALTQHKTKESVCGTLYYLYSYQLATTTRLWASYQDTMIQYWPTLLLILVLTDTTTHKGINQCYYYYSYQSNYDELFSILTRLLFPMEVVDSNGNVDADASIIAMTISPTSQLNINRMVSVSWLLRSIRGWINLGPFWIHSGHTYIASALSWQISRHHDLVTVPLCPTQQQKQTLSPFEPYHIQIDQHYKSYSYRLTLLLIHVSTKSLHEGKGQEIEYKKWIGWERSLGPNEPIP